MTIDEIIAANKANGGHFFDEDTMRFFDSRVYDRTYGTFFVTSEKGPHGPRAYTVRQAMPDGSVDTVGKFMGYETRADAEREAARLYESANHLN